MRRFTGAGAAEAARLIALYHQGRPGASPVELYQLISTDYWIGTDTMLQAERKAALHGAPVWLYRFDKTTPVRAGKLRSPHMLEIPYVLHNLDKAAEFTGRNQRNAVLEDVLSRCWTRFAATGDPNGAGLPHWPAFDRGTRPLMAVDDVSRVEFDPHRLEREAVLALRARQGDPVAAL